jgi:hypothetical protein
MSTFSDDSGSTQIARKIKQVQFIPEPTPAQYINPIAPNLYRTPVIQEDQIPVSQILDRHTKIGHEIKNLEDSQKIIDQSAKAIYAKRQAEEKDKSWAKTIMKYSPGITQLIGSVLTGDISGVSRGLSSVLRTQQSSVKQSDAEQAARLRHDKAEAKLLLQELKGKRKKRVKTTHKGQKVEVE